MRYRLRTLVVLTAVAPPLLAAAWLWCRQLMYDAAILLMCLVLAAAILLPGLVCVGLACLLLKRAARLMVTAGRRCGFTSAA